MTWGGFHAECIFMSVISERFLDGGRKDLVIEARLLKEGSIISLLSSPHYNKAMRIHEYVYEDVLWRWRFFYAMQNTIVWRMVGLVEVNDASSPITRFKNLN